MPASAASGAVALGGACVEAGWSTSVGAALGAPPSTWPPPDRTPSGRTIRALATHACGKDFKGQDAGNAKGLKSFSACQCFAVAICCEHTSDMSWMKHSQGEQSTS